MKWLPVIYSWDDSACVSLMVGTARLIPHDMNEFVRICSLCKSVPNLFCCVRFYLGTFFIQVNWQNMPWSFINPDISFSCKGILSGNGHCKGMTWKWDCCCYCIQTTLYIWIMIINIQVNYNDEPYIELWVCANHRLITPLKWGQQSNSFSLRIHDQQLHNA